MNPTMSTFFRHFTKECKSTLHKPNTTFYGTFLVPVAKKGFAILSCLHTTHENEIATSL